MAFPETLETLIEEGVIDAVRSRLMSGKEASVFVVERQGELLAAKVYKAREQRTFKATASYTEGRNQTRNSRDKRAMGKRTSYGRELIEESWRDVEVRALSEAFHAGVRVPQPFMLHDDVLLMELLVDEHGAPAPRLADFELPREVAEQLHREIFSQVRLLLSCGKIHGDLSAFNILMARGGPTLIDMPQVVDAARNNQAREILRRDLRNVTEHLARFDARLLRFRDCGDALWQHYVNDTLDRATEPQEGGVGGGHHRSRRTRDAERGRMGRERPDPGAGRRDGPPHHGPPRPAGHGPPRPAGHGPPRDRQPYQGGGGPPRARSPQATDGAPREPSPRTAAPPRDQGQHQGGGEPPPRTGAPPRDPGPHRTGGESPQPTTAALPRDPGQHQGGGGPLRERPPQGGSGPPRDRPLGPGADGWRRDRPSHQRPGRPPRDRQFPRADGPQQGQSQPASGPRGEGPHSGAAGYRPPREATLPHGNPGQGPARDGPRHPVHGPPRERPPQGPSHGPSRAGGFTPGPSRTPPPAGTGERSAPSRESAAVDGGPRQAPRDEPPQGGQGR